MWYVDLLPGNYRETTVQQPLLSNRSANKYVSTAAKHSNNGRDVFYAVLDEML
jgi:hypothetical protein